MILKMSQNDMPFCLAFHLAWTIFRYTKHGILIRTKNTNPTASRPLLWRNPSCFETFQAQVCFFTVYFLKFQTAILITEVFVKLYFCDFFFFNSSNVIGRKQKTAVPKQKWLMLVTSAVRNKAPQRKSPRPHSGLLCVTTASTIWRPANQVSQLSWCVHQSNQVQFLSQAIFCQRW